MLIKKPDEIASSEVTSKEHYLNRRKFIQSTGLVGANMIAAHLGTESAASGGAFPAGNKLQFAKSSLSTQGEPLTPLQDILGFNNFYEFGSDKDDPARLAGSLRPTPWTIKVEGMVRRPNADYDVDSIVKMHPSLEERVYRMRCVETWSMVIPWIGVPLASVIKALQPSAKAKYVAFETLYDPKQMPGQRGSRLQWPYTEALRMDEAMHPLTILAVGLYGEPLPNPEGAPIRLVVPWKYGFKSIKSIVKIRFVESQPATTWNTSAPHEYGFFANVNPEVDHPRWSQANERRIGDFSRHKTLVFNGYAEQVSRLYSGMDLRKYY
jgi:sulfoxide reductase catalytic subunit YedY